MMRLIVLICVVLSSCAAFGQVRIKDLAVTKGVRAHVLVGYGLVVGLNGSGDSARNSVFTKQSIRTMLERLGVGVGSIDIRTRNVAAVIVSAEVSPTASQGTRVDIAVSSLGDAKSLLGGTLIVTPLLGGDGKVYAIAQGQVVVAGFQIGGKSEVITQGVPTSGRIANGAIIDRALRPNQSARRVISIELLNPDPSTVVSAVDRINEYSLKRYGMRIARGRSEQSISLHIPRKISRVRLLSEIGRLTISPDIAARIVIDPRSGTVVMSSSVRVSKVAVTHGSLTVRVTESAAVSQPAPLSNGNTTVVPNTSVQARQTGGKLAVVGGDLETLIGGLNRVGVKPAGIIAVLHAMKTAGAIQAELIVQ